MDRLISVLQFSHFREEENEAKGGHLYCPEHDWDGGTQGFLVLGAGLFLPEKTAMCGVGRPHIRCLS